MTAMDTERLRGVVEGWRRKKERPPTQVLALAGGGPAAGLHVGALERLHEIGKLHDFNVWSLSCIGAWVGIVWQQTDPGHEVAETTRFFREGVFRDDTSYRRFPINRVFGPDLASNRVALLQFVCDPSNYRDLVLPTQIVEAMKDTLHFLRTPSRWNAGDFNVWMLDSVLAVNPWSRFLTSMVYQSNINGLSRIWYERSTFLHSIRFKRLEEPDKPLIYHNAWNLDRRRLELFTNRPVPGRDYRYICAKSLCACSALPYIESTVEMDGDTYCEGALVDTLSFRNLVEDHVGQPGDKNARRMEVWVSRIVDTDQIREPRNLTDALGNLCMLFAAETGKNDVKLFRYHLGDDGFADRVRIVEIPVSARINFDWSRTNFDRGVEEGRRAVNRVVEEQVAIGRVQTRAERMTGAKLNDDEARDLLHALPERRWQRDKVIAKLVAPLSARKAAGNGEGRGTRQLPIDELIAEIVSGAPPSGDDMT